MNKRTLRVVIFVAASLLLAITTKANDIYISQTGGGNGTACNSPLSVSYFNTPGNWGSGKPIGPGTTVHLCGTFTGSAGSTLLTFYGSGTSTSPITLLFESNAVVTAPYWATGNGTSPGGGAIDLNGQSYLVINGGSNGVIEDSDNGSSCSISPKPSPCFDYSKSSLAIDATSTTNITVENLAIQNMYVHSSPSDDAVSFSTDGCVVYIDANNVTISSVTAHDVHWCFNGSANNLSISGSTVYNMDHGVMYGSNVPGQTFSGITIYNSHFHDMANWSTDNDAYHHDSIHIYGEESNGSCPAGGSGAYISNVTIYNNLFDGDPGNDLTSTIFLQCYVSDVNVFNNVFHYPAGRGTSNGIIGYNNQGGSHAQNIFLANNTVLGGDLGNGDGCVSLQKNSTNQEDITFLDNVVAQCDTSLMGVNATFAPYGTAPPTGLDNNVYHEDVSTSDEFNYLGNWYHTLSEWQSGTGQDTNAVFVPMGSTLGLSDQGIVETGSPVIGAGENLSSLCTGNLAALCFDKGGARRPTSGAWDSGAYQYGTHQISRLQTVAPAYVHASQQSVSLTETAGDLLVAATAYQIAGANVTVTDTLGNTWTSLSAFGNSNCGTSDGNYSGVQLWYAQNIKGGANTITMQVNQTTYIALAVAEYSGVATTNALESSSGFASTGSSSSISAGNLYPTGPNNLIVGFFNDEHQTTNMTAESGYADIANTGLTSMLEDLFPEGPYTSGPISPSATYTNGSDACGVATAAAFISK